MPHQKLFGIVIAYVYPIIGFDLNETILNQTLSSIILLVSATLLLFVANEIIIRTLFAPLLGLKRKAKNQNLVSDK